MNTDSRLSIINNNMISIMIVLIAIIVAGTGAVVAYISVNAVKYALASTILVLVCIALLTIAKLLANKNNKNIMLN